MLLYPKASNLPTSISTNFEVGNYASIGGNLAVKGNETLTGTFSGLSTGSNSFLGSLNVTKSLTAAGITGTGLNINGNGSFTGNVGIGTNLTVTGQTSLTTASASATIEAITFKGTTYSGDGAITFGNASALTTVTGSSLTISPTAWTATPTISGLITATSGLTANGALTANSTFTLGDNGDTGSINTSDWDISTSGALTGISGISNDGAYTQSGTGINTLTGQLNILSASASGTIEATSLISNNILQVNGSSILGYNRFGVGTTTHSLSSANDVLISGKLEVDGDIFVDGTLYAGAISYNSASVSGNFEVGGTLQLADGSAANPSATFTNDLDTGLFRIGSNNLGFTTGGVQRLNISDNGASISGNFDPSSNNTYDLGDSSYRWRDLNLGRNALIAGNVGIGTTVTNYKLEVLGASHTYAGITAGTDSVSGLYLNNDARSWILKNDGQNNDYFAIREGSVADHLVILKTSGNVGIGTTGPGYKLQVESTGDDVLKLVSTRNVAGADVGVNVIHNRGIANVLDNDTLNLFTGKQDSDTTSSAITTRVKQIIEDATHATRSSALQFQTMSNGTLGDKVRITSTGNVGIGTTAPGNILDVAGTPSGTTYQIISRDTTAQAAGVGGGITFFGKATDAGGYGRMGGIKGIKANATTGNYLGGLAFLIPTSAASDVLLEKMRIDSSGNVGIGTTAPNDKFQVNVGINQNWGIRATGSIPNFEAINDARSGYVAGMIDASPLILNSQSTGNVGIGTTTPNQLLYVYSANSSARAYVDAAVGSQAGYGYSKGGVAKFLSYVPADSNDLRFYDGSADRVTFQSGGNVGIGTTAPGYKLEVQGTGYFNGQFTQTGGTANFGGAWVNIGSGYGATGISFSDTGNGSFNGNLTVDGNVGIGTTSPTAKLQVAGSILSTNLISSGIGQFGGTSTVSYSRFGTNTTSHSLSSANDVLISGKLEVDGDIFVDGTLYAGAISYNSASVSGNFEVGGTLQLADGSAANPSATFTNDLDTGLFRIGSNNLGFTTGGVQRLNISDNGASISVPFEA